jgi:DNA-directed RNA polymerase omega subunit
VSNKNPPSRFEFVVTAGARARQLIAGSTPRVAAGNHKKVTIAKQEVLTGLVERLPAAVPDAKTDL